MDRIFKAVEEEVAASPRFMQELFRLNYERKRGRYQEGYCSPFLDRIVFKKIRRLLGGRLKGVLSGGAPLNAETQRFMNICMCCPVIQGYGLTETCGAACVADINDLSTGTVGPPVRCADIALREWTEGLFLDILFIVLLLIDYLFQGAIPHSTNPREVKFSSADLMYLPVTTSSLRRLPRTLSCTRWVLNYFH